MSYDFVPRQKINHHWARPRFLHYSSIYDYMNSYYDDEIDYLNKKQRGLTVDPPRAQSWTERALRIQMRPRYSSPISWETTRDPGTHTLLRSAHWVGTSIKVHHSTNYYNRKYRSIL